MATLILYPDDIVSESWKEHGSAEVDVIVYRSPAGDKVIKGPFLNSVEADEAPKKITRPRKSK